MPVEGITVVRFFKTREIRISPTGRAKTNSIRYCTSPNCDTVQRSLKLHYFFVICGSWHARIRSPCWKTGTQKILQEKNYSAPHTNITCVRIRRVGTELSQCTESGKPNTRFFVSRLAGLDLVLGSAMPCCTNEEKKWKGRMKRMFYSIRCDFLIFSESRHSIITFFSQ